jgi:hypothetical protein
VLIGLQTCHHQSTDGKDQCSYQIQPHEFDHKILQIGRETWRDTDFGFDDWLSKHRDKYGYGSCSDECQIGDP